MASLLRCPSTPASPASSTAATTLEGGRLRRGRTCRTSPGTSSSRSARRSKEKTGHKLLGIDINDAGSIRIMMQSAGQWYFDADGDASHRRQPDLQGGARDLSKLCRPPASISLSPAGTNLPAPSPRAKSLRCRSGVWIDRDRSRPPTSPANGASPRSRSSRTSRAPRTLPTSAVRAGTSSRPRRKGRGHRFPRRNLGQGHRLLPEDPRRPGRPRIAASRPAKARPTRPATTSSAASRSGRTSPTGSLPFRPSTTASSPTKSTRRSSRRLPALAKGGSVDEAIEAIDAQVKQQIQ